jgi:hypothetical protein
VRFDPGVNAFLLDVIQRHQISAHAEGSWVVIDGSPIRVNGAVQNGKSDRPDFASVQLEMRLLLPDGRVVVQQVVGWGNDRQAAINHAQASFLIGTFHAWLSAFVEPEDEHLRPAERVIAGRKRLLTVGDTLTKSAGGQKVVDDRAWYEQLLRELDRNDPGEGTHWVDVYHGAFQGKQEMEIQLDNARWSAFEEKMRAAPWPDNGTFTSVRQFIVVQELNDPMRPTHRPTTLPSTAPAATSRGIH